MEFLDPLTPINIFHFPYVARQLVANFILVGLATILVGLRFVARRVRKTKIWWDDVLAVVSMVCVIGLLALQIMFANRGIRYHFIELPLANMIHMAKLLVALQPIYYTGIAAVKLSYLWFYLRIFPHKNFRIWVWVCVGLVAAYWLGSMLSAFLLCRPFEMNWNVNIPWGHCSNPKPAYVASGIFNMITDFIIVLLPLPFIRHLQMATGTKIGLAAVFGIGLLVTGITMIRISVLLNIDYDDASYYPDGIFWSVSEPAIAVINCCIPTLRPLLRIVSPARFWNSHKGDTTDGLKLSGYPSSSGRRSTNKVLVDHDQYPLTLIEDGMTNTGVTCGGTQSSAETKSYAISDYSLKNAASIEGNWGLDRDPVPVLESMPSPTRPQRGRIIVQQRVTVESQNAKVT